jgi:hypothetical protein
MDGLLNRLRRLSLVKDAIEIVVRRVSFLSPSAEVEELRTQAEEYLREAESWKASPPTGEERERLMKHVLKLHVAVAILERRS